MNGLSVCPAVSRMSREPNAYHYNESIALSPGPVVCCGPSSYVFSPPRDPKGRRTLRGAASVRGAGFPACLPTAWPADSHRSYAPSGLWHVLAHNRGLGSLSPGYSPTPLTGLHACRVARSIVLGWPWSFSCPLHVQALLERATLPVFYLICVHLCLSVVPFPLPPVFYLICVHRVPVRLPAYGMAYGGVPFSPEAGRNEESFDI